MSEDPTLFQLESLLIGSDAILTQEKRGQDKIVQSDVLPREMQGCTKEDFERLGFVFGDAVDDLFYECTYPSGWRKVATEQSRLSHIVDTDGVKRGSIFYKAAYYDRHAHVHMITRYSAEYEPLGGYEQENYRDKPKIAYVLDHKTNTRIWVSDPLSEDTGYFELRVPAEEWLDSHYPEWRDIRAYWDNEVAE